MKELLSVFHSDIFKTVMVYLLPGAVFVYPWYRALIFMSPEIKEVLPHSEISRISLLVGLATLAGILLENLGGWLEVRFDKQCAKKDPNSDDATCWHRFLRTAFTVEPIGLGYVRTLVARMKLEFNLGFALLGAIPTIWLCYVKLINTSNCIATVLTIAMLFLSLYLLLWEAATTHGVLVLARKNLCMKEIIIISASVTAAGTTSTNSVKSDESPLTSQYPTSE